VSPLPTAHHSCGDTSSVARALTVAAYACLTSVPQVLALVELDDRVPLSVLAGADSLGASLGVPARAPVSAEDVAEMDAFLGPAGSIVTYDEQEQVRARHLSR
jgi:hypothetical protein